MKKGKTPPAGFAGGVEHAQRAEYGVMRRTARKAEWRVTGGVDGEMAQTERAQLNIKMYF